MRDFILFMHRDATTATSPRMWADYLADLRERGVFDGGAGIGEGEAFRKAAVPAPLSEQISGYIRIRAPDLATARGCLAGNPVFECGGTVEIRELPRT
jgi:hypothetical protein